MIFERSEKKTIWNLHFLQWHVLAYFFNTSLVILGGLQALSVYVYIDS